MGITIVANILLAFIMGIILSTSGGNTTEEQIKKEPTEISTTVESDNSYVSQALSEQRKAENRLVTAILQKEKLIEEIEEQERKIREIPHGETLKKLKTSLASKKRLLVEQDKIVTKKVQKLENKLLELADYYAKIEKTGDPVDVNTGRFVAEYDDFQAEDFLNKFNIKRKLDYGNYKGSFGKNWICSLDARIIRCNYKDFTQSEKNVIEIINILDEILAEIDSLREDYGTISGNLQGIYNEFIKKKDFYTEDLEYIRYVIDKRKEIIEKNKYVAYGKYENENELYGGEELLIFIDDSGTKYLFQKENNCLWRAVGEPESNIYTVNEINQSNDGYELCNINGNKLIFSKYGVLEKYIDKNNNETIFNNLNGKISEVILKTGEHINIERDSNNKILSIKGTVSGDAYYFYENDKLISVVDNKGIKNNYKYNDNGDLILIEKDKNQEVKIAYEYNKDLNHNVCTSIENDNGDIEYFDLDVKNHRMIHNIYGEGSEIYYFDNNGYTTYYKDIYNNEINIKRDDLGRIYFIEENGLVKKFVYNREGKICSVQYDNGTCEDFYYNKLGYISKLIDRDGLSNSYEYDVQGNLIQTSFCNMISGEYSYYKNGLLKNYKENNNFYELKYNNFGSITEKNITYPNGKKIKSTWEYDNKNRLIKSCETGKEETNIKYNDNLKTSFTDNTKRIEYFNQRNQKVKEEVSDFISGEKFIKENVYDKNGNIVKIIIDNKTFAEYTYYKNNCLKEYIIWNNPKEQYEEFIQGIKIELKYNEDWMISQVIKSRINHNEIIDSVILSKYEYKKNHNNLYVKIKKYLEPERTFIYNNAGQIIKAIFENDYYIKYNYSKGGKLISENDIFNNKTDYIYNLDGSYKKIISNSKGTLFTYYYNHKSQLERITDYFGFSYFSKYDSNGNKIFEKGPLYENKREYDQYNRLIYNKYQDNKGNILLEYNIQFEDNLKEKRILVDGHETLYEKYDSYSRVIERNNINGHYFYKYDYLGNCNQISDYYGNKTLIINSPDGEIIAEILPDGTYKKYKYNINGNLEKLAINDYELFNCTYGENSLSFAHLSSQTTINHINNQYKINNAATGTYTISKDKNRITETDASDHLFITTYNEKGQLINETNQLGAIASFEYDNYGMQSKITNYLGQNKIISFDFENNREIYKFDSGNLGEVVRDGLGNIIKITMGNYSTEYKYDKRNNLISEYSQNSNTKIKYEYDSYSRCIRKTGPNFDYYFDYDEMGRIKKAGDNLSGSWVSFSFDNLSRIEKKNFSNGGVCNISYNKNGKIESLVYKNNLGLIIYSDLIKYDNFGRIKSVTDRNGFVSIYKYDERSRIIETVTPYTKEKENYYLEEMIQCGYFDNNVRPLLKAWKEQYSYDDNGNITIVKNPYGSIIYKYDSANRLIYKGFNNTNEDGIKVHWNKNNSIESIKNKLYKVEFEYGDQKRPNEKKIIDFNTGEINITEYFYDVLGRRVVERTNEEIIEYIYDGFSPNIISKQLLSNTNSIASIVNNNFTFENNNYETLQHNKYKNNTKMRTVDNSKYRPYGTEKSYNTNLNTVKNYIKPDVNEYYSTLTIDQLPLIVSYIDGNKEKAIAGEICISDFRNRIVGSVNNLCDYNHYTETDFFKSDFNNSLAIRNIGFRDYFPMLKTFTSEDPIRDGYNWFAYCVCDPINYSDNNGLEKNAYTKSQNYLYKANIISYCNFNKQTYKLKNMQHEYYMNLFHGFDCADTAIQMQVIACERAGLPLVSQVAQDFAKKSRNGYMYSAMHTVNTASLALGLHVRQICKGFDEDYLLNCKSVSPELINTETYKTEQKKKDDFYNNIKNPQNVDIGSVLLWQNSDTPRPGAPAECGHVATVLARKFDINGNVVGFITLEGHTGGNKTELTYISVEDVANNSNIKSYMGKFMGVYEVENADNQKNVTNCIK